MNKAALNMYVEDFMWTSVSSSFGYMQTGQSPGHMVRECSVLYAMAEMSSEACCLFLNFKIDL